MFPSVSLKCSRCEATYLTKLLLVSSVFKNRTIIVVMIGTVGTALYVTKTVT